MWGKSLYFFVGHWFNVFKKSDHELSAHMFYLFLPWIVDIHFKTVNLSVQFSERIWPIGAEGCLMFLFLQYVSSNKSYLLLFLPRHRLCPHSVIWFTINVHNLHSHCCLSTPGLIWSRYSLVIIPKNWNLFCVNFFVGSAGASQLYRIWRFVVHLHDLADQSPASTN